MNDLLRIADQYFQAAFALPLSTLLAPLRDEEGPAGTDLRDSALFRDIQKARLADDPNLPLGPWERELKKADWPTVGKLTSQALSERSKDLQLAAWLLESGLHRHGFIALAPCLTLLREMLDQFWVELYPDAPEGDLDYRVNIFRWMDDKFPKLIALLPLTQSGRDEGEMKLADWRRANLPDEEGRHDPAKQDEFLTVLASTPSEWLSETMQRLVASRQALECLDECLDKRCGDESPGFRGLTGVIDEISAILEPELRQRVSFEDTPTPDEIQAREEAEAMDADVSVRFHGAEPPPSGSAIHRRQDAYAMLARAADYLIQTDPHSPVPYLVRQAIAWGQMDTRALYQELFLEQGGQINVFHLLGLKSDEAA
ncbi:MAG: type VI secretion system protein TssA [Gammaproteobacteria bacterium]